MPEQPDHGTELPASSDFGALREALEGNTPDTNADLRRAYVEMVGALDAAYARIGALLAEAKALEDQIARPSDERN